MKTRKRRGSLLMTGLTLLALCAALTVSTYAWFTFDPYTNVTPMEGKISDGDTNLLISEKKDSGFDKKCELNPTDRADELYPVSTAKLEKFFASSAQRQGISTHFRDVSGELGKWLIHGTVYLQCLGTDCDVYFDRETLDFGTDIQVLAAGRLGLKITGQDEKSTTLIFRLDDLGDTAKAKQTRTVAPEGDVVVAAIDDKGSPEFEDDPALSIGGYLRSADNPKKLCTLEMDEVASVEYWLYLEGCDDHCSNPLQTDDEGKKGRQIVLKLGFEGEEAAE